MNIRTLAFLYALLASDLAAEPLKGDASSRQALGISLTRQEPSALSRGEQTGGALSWTRSRSSLSYGVHGGLGLTSLSNQSWAIEHTELRLHPHLSLNQELNGATLSLVAGLGLTSLHEGRSRHQAARLGLSGAARETSAQRLSPEARLALQLSLPVTRSLSALLSFGALYRLSPLSPEDPLLTLSQGLGLEWSFKG